MVRADPSKRDDVYSEAEGAHPGTHTASDPASFSPEEPAFTPPHAPATLVVDDDNEEMIEEGSPVTAKFKSAALNSSDEPLCTTSSRDGSFGGDDQGDEPDPESYEPASKWWSLSLRTVFNLVQLEDSAQGLDANDVPRHAEELGDNTIPIKGGPRWYLVLASQFMNAITVILVAVAVISAVFKDWAEFGVVVFILIFNAALGFYQEWGAEKSLASLKEMTAGVAKVMRNGTPEVIFVDEVVVGDVVILEQGASVPADCRVFESNSLEVDEALLTGEALPVAKHANVIPDPDLRCALGDRKNMVFRNTEVTQGRGKAVVCAGGVHTEMGKLADRLGSGGGSTKTALMKKLDYLMFVLFGCCVVLAIVVFASNKMQYHPSTLSYATAVAIAILPESLNVVITVAMTVSVKKMAQKKCIVRKLTVLEVLGGVTDICSDKTGTLTENKMVVKKAVIGTNDTLTVGGAPYEIHGDFYHVEEGTPGAAAGSAANGASVRIRTEAEEEEKGIHMAHAYDSHEHWREFMRCSALCSTTALKPTEEDAAILSGSGNPTEVAIQVMTWKAGLHRDALARQGWSNVVAEYAFDSAIKRMSIVWQHDKTRQIYACTKGAPERVLELCNFKLDVSGAVKPLTEADRHEVERHIDDLAAQGLRTICLAYRHDANDSFPVPKNQPFGDVYDREQLEHDLTYLGIVGIYDPPRPESRPSVIACQHAGIRVRMLTGDHTSTAGSIASMLNIIFRRDLEDPVKLQAGPDFDKIDPAVIDGWADLPYVIGRCSPESKVKMIESLHRRKRVVAMTGDGFNDSPSIKIADVGCAMGSGVDVTKSVADLVITDDNFSTIVKAVAEGRRIQQCIRKFVVHLLSGNVAEVVALICGLPIRHEGVALFVLSPVEILWLNLLTSGPPATGLSLDSPTPDILQVAPHTAGLFTPELICDTLIYGVMLGACTLCSFVFILFGIHGGPSGTDCNSSKGIGCEEVWSTRATAFSIIYFGLFLHAYTVRHPRMSVFKMKWLDNKWLWGSILFGAALFFPIVYVEPIARIIFIHHMLTWHWAVLVVALIIFFSLSELYKVLKNCLFPIHKIIVHVEQEEDHESANNEPGQDGTVSHMSGYTHATNAEVDDALRDLEVRTYADVDEDSRDIQSIAEENLRQSFASMAGAMGGGGAASSKSKKTTKVHFRRK